MAISKIHFRISASYLYSMRCGDSMPTMRTTKITHGPGDITHTNGERGAGLRTCRVTATWQMVGGFRQRVADTYCTDCPAMALAGIQRRFVGPGARVDANRLAVRHCFPHVVIQEREYGGYRPVDEHMRERAKRKRFEKEFLHNWRKMLDGMPAAHARPNE